MDDEIHALVGIDEASRVMMDFIGTPRFESVVTSIQDNARAGFITGMSYMMCLIIGRCKRFYCRVNEKEEPKTDQEPQGYWKVLYRPDDTNISIMARCSVCNLISTRPLGHYCRWCGSRLSESEPEQIKMES